MAARVTVERTIAAPPERVFAVAIDIHHWAEIVPAIQRVDVLTPGPMAVGTRFRETRKMMGREATEEMTVTGFDPPRGYVLAAESHGCRYRTELRFEPEGAGTRMVFEFGAEPLTLAAKVMMALMKPMMKKAAQMCAKDLEAIEAHVLKSA
jgi:carbon monoxide dehydrogenase subunit G